MRHIMFISHSRGIHGAEAVMIQAIQACINRGTRVTVVVPSIGPEEGLTDVMKNKKDVTLLSLPYRSAGKNIIRTQLVRLYNLYALMLLARYVRNNGVDTVYSTTTITIIGSDLTRHSHCRHIWHWHEPVDERFGWHHSLKHLYSRIAQRADVIICISHQQQNEWQNTLEVELSNAQIIYNPIKRIAFSARDNSLIHKDITFGFIGHFEERKNIELLIHTFERLHKIAPDTRLLLCGAIDERDRNYVLKMTNLREPELVIMEQTSCVENFYSNVDVLVLPSWRETMPLVVLEAMQLGVCVLQTNRSGMNELIIDEKESLFFSPDDPEQLFSYMNRCLNNDYREQIAREGQNRAIKLVDNQMFDQQIQNLLCE